jgi:hypothetical protein
MLIFLVPVLSAVAPSVWGQAVRLQEVKAHLRRALEEVLGKRDIERDTIERLQEVFYQEGKILDKAEATNRLAALVQQDSAQTFDERARSKLSLFQDQDPGLVLQTSGQFVDSVSSVIRRLSIVKETVHAARHSSITINFGIT